MDVRRRLSLYPSLMPTKSNRKGTALARFWSTPCGPPFPSSFCVLYSPFLCQILCQYFFALSEVRGNCSSGGHVGTQQCTLETKQQVDLGLKFQFGTWSHWLKWQVHFLFCYWHSCPSGLIFVLTRRKVSMVQRRAVLPAPIKKPAGLLLNQK